MNESELDIQSGELVSSAHDAIMFGRLFGFTVLISKLPMAIVS
jgi:hypothetical protein